MSTYKTFSRDEAIKEMRDSARMLVDPAFAEDLLLPFGQNLAMLEITPRPANTFYRATGNELDAVAIESVAQRLALAICPHECLKAWRDEMVAAGGHFHGRGSRAAAVTNKACDLIAALTDA